MDLIYIFTFIKKYWAIGLIIGIVIYHFTKTNNIKQLLDISSKSHEAQVVEIKKLHSEELKKREEIQRSHEQKLEEIDKKYKMAKWALKQEREKAIKTIQTETPEQVAKRIEKAFGLKYVPKETFINNP